MDEPDRPRVPDQVTLSAEQQCSVDQIQSLFESHRVVMLVGAAGTGKSVVVAKLLREWTAAGIRAAVTAISHKSLAQHRETAASIAAEPGLKGVPPHTAVWAKLKIDADWWARVLLGKARKKPTPWYNVSGRKVLVVEEYGLWTAEQIAILDAVLRSLFKARQMPFGGVLLLCSGDEGQIDPRGGKRASTHPLLRRAPRVELKESRRYAHDRDWGHLLRELEKPQIPGGLADQLVQRRRALEPPPGSLILGQSRADVRAAVAEFRETPGVGTLLVPSDPATIEGDKDAEEGRFVGGQTEGWLVYGCTDLTTKSRATEQGSLLTNGTDIRYERVETLDGTPIEADTVTMGENVAVVVTLLKSNEEVALAPLEMDGHFVVPIRHGTFSPGTSRAAAPLTAPRRIHHCDGPGHDGHGRRPRRGKRNNPEETVSSRRPARNPEGTVYSRTRHHGRGRVDDLHCHRHRRPAPYIHFRRGVPVYRIRIANTSTPPTVPPNEAYSSESEADEGELVVLNTASSSLSNTTVPAAALA